jgi:hypothetical protein
MLAGLASGGAPAPRIAPAVVMKVGAPPPSDKFGTGSFDETAQRQRAARAMADRFCQLTAQGGLLFLGGY